MTEKDLRIQELETLVAQQQARIAELETADVYSLQQEIQQLQAIIEAQEEAMAEQKQIIAQQSTLLDDLSGHLKTNGVTMLSDAIDEDQAVLGSPPRTPPGTSSQPVLSGGSSYQVRRGGGRSSVTASTQGVNRRNPPPGGRGAPGMGHSTNSGSHPSHSGSHSSLSNRSQQREQLNQKLQARAGTNSNSTVDHPRAPRPNSAVGRGGATPRARSWTERGSNSAPSTSARGPSPTRSPDSTQSSQYSQHSVSTVNVMSKKTGGPLPPALPIL